MIKYSKEAQKTILEQGKTTALRLYRAIEKLPEGDVKKLQGSKDRTLYRLRVGGYRVVFCSEGELITVLRIDTRGDVYKRL